MSTALSDVLIENARLICPARGEETPLGWALVRAGHIADVGAGAAPDAEGPRVDAAGLALAPGLIDVGARADLSGATGDDLETLARAALAGGVTTVALSPESAPAADGPEDVALLARQEAPIHTLPIGRFCVGEAAHARIAELGLMREAGVAAAGLGRRPSADARLMHAGMRYAAAFGLPVLSPAKDPTLGAAAVAHAGPLAARLGLTGAPATAEALAITRDALLAADAGGLYVADGVSTRAGLDALRAAKAKDPGGRVFAIAYAFNLTFNELDIADFNPAFRLDPPLRAEEDRQALIEAVADGTIDVIASGHDAVPLERKQRAFPDATPGAPGLETLLAAAIGLAQDDRMPLAQALRPLTVGPARVLGLGAEVGALRAGAPADLVLFEPAAPWACRATRFLSGGRITPFEGRLLNGRVRMVWRGGRTAYDAGGSAR